MRPGPKRPQPTPRQLALCRRVCELRDREAAEMQRMRMDLAEAVRDAKGSGLSWRHLEELTGIRHQTLRSIVDQ